MNWHEYFTYDRETGLLYWKERPMSHFKDLRGGMTWNARWSGKLAGMANKYGYVIVGVGWRRRSVHCIIYEMMVKPIPVGMFIDHRNGNRSDNRIENMRLCTRSENNRNCKPKRNGLKGVFLDKRRGTYAACITVDRKRIWLGSHKTEELAHAAYCEAAKKYHGEFARTS